MRGMSMMVSAPPVVVPPHGQVVFQPRGYHLMLTGLKEPLRDRGQQEITLVFKRAGAIRASFRISAQINLGTEAPMRGMTNAALNGLAQAAPSGHVRGAMFIQTEATPNPDVLKFLPGRDVLGEGATREFRDAEQATASPLAAELFALGDVTRVFYGPDFVTVMRSPGGREWMQLKPPVLAAIMDHFTGGRPAASGRAAGRA